MRDNPFAGMASHLLSEPPLVICARGQSPGRAHADHESTFQ